MISHVYPNFFSSKKRGLVPESDGEPGRALSRTDGHFRMRSLDAVWKINWMGEVRQAVQ